MLKNSIYHTLCVVSLFNVIDCVGEPEVENAVLIETFGLYKNLEHAVRYKCQDGRKLLGRPWAFCQHNGTWNTLFTCCEYMSSNHSDRLLSY